MCLSCSCLPLFTEAFTVWAFFAGGGGFSSSDCCDWPGVCEWVTGCSECLLCVRELKGMSLPPQSRWSVVWCKVIVGVSVWVNGCGCECVGEWVWV